MAKPIEIDAKRLGLCVCGRPIYVDIKSCAVLHVLPYCYKFLELEPDEFLTYVRRSRGIPDAAVERVQ
jgi:hypothetical protein